MEKNKITGRQWAIMIVESLGWSGVMVMGYFFSSYYALIQSTFGYENMQISNLVALMSGAGAICYLCGGFLADAFSPKINLAISYIGLTVCGAVILMKPSYLVMQVMAVLVSVFGLGTFVPTMLKYVASIGSREQMPKLYGWFYALAAAEALVIAPIASRLMSTGGDYAGLRIIVIFFCVMMIVSMLFHFGWVERVMKLEGGEKNEDDKFSWKMVPQLLKNPNMYFVILLACFTLLPYDLNTYVQPLLASQFEASQSMIQFVASYANNGTALILAPLAGIIAAKLGSTSKVMTMSIVLGAGATLGILFCPWDRRYVVLAVVIVFCLRSVFSIGKPSRNSMIGESRLPRKARGTVLGLMFAVTGLQSTIVAKGAGYLTTVYEGATGYRYLYIIALVIFLVGIIVSIIFDKRLQKAKERDKIEGAPEDLMI